MYHIMSMSGTFYGVDVSSLDEEDRNKRIEGFTSEGTGVLIVDELHDVDAFGISDLDITIVELDE